MAAQYALNGGDNVQFLSKYVRAQGTLTHTDIDMIIDGVYYQAKISGGAFGSLNDVTEWVRKATGDGATTIKYVTPSKAAVPPIIRSWLESKNIDILEVPNR